MPSQRIQINAPQAEVFNYLADISKHGEWGNPSQKLHVAKTSAGPIERGSTFESTGQQFGKQEDTVTITEYAPSHRVAYESQGKAGTVRHSFEITPAGSGVEVEKSFEVVKAGFPFVIFQPIVMSFLVPRALQQDLERIKARLESTAGG